MSSELVAYCLKSFCSVLRACPPGTLSAALSVLLVNAFLLHMLHLVQSLQRHAAISSCKQSKQVQQGCMVGSRHLQSQSAGSHLRCRLGARLSSPSSSRLDRFMPASKCCRAEKSCRVWGVGGRGNESRLYGSQYASWCRTKRLLGCADALSTAHVSPSQTGARQQHDCGERQQHPTSRTCLA